MFMKDHSSFGSCILSFSLTTISETSIMGFCYLSVWVVTKSGFINRLAVYMSNIFYLLPWYRSTMEVENKIRKRSIFFQRSLFFSPSFILEIGKKKKISSNCSGIFFFNFHSHQLSWPVSSAIILWTPDGTIIWTLIISESCK